MMAAMEEKEANDDAPDAGNLTSGGKRCQSCHKEQTRR